MKAKISLLIPMLFSAQIACAEPLSKGDRLEFLGDMLAISDACSKAWSKIDDSDARTKEAYSIMKEVSLIVNNWKEQSSIEDQDFVNAAINKRLQEIGGDGMDDFSCRIMGPAFLGFYIGYGLRDM